jgi:RNA recognition motif-containing protein
MASKVFVGNLAYSATEDDLRTLFAQSGIIKSVNVVRDRDTGRSRGFAFVEMSTPSEAQRAISMLHGTSFKDRTLTVDLARPRDDRPRDRYGSGGGGRSRRYSAGESGEPYL